MAFTASELAERLGARLVGDGAVRLGGLAALASAGPEQLSHLSSPAYRRYLATTRAGAVLCRQVDAADVPTVALIVEDPYVAYATASHWFAPPAPVEPGIATSAVIASDARIASSATIGPGVIVGAGSVVGEHAVIGAHACIGRGCRIGDHGLLHARVTLYDDVWLGERCIVHSGAVLGADGFGFARERTGRQRKIAQLGGVRIGADVEIGANTTIDRGALDPTVIEEGVKIDNQVQIGHNCHVGAHTVICGCVGIVGSTRIGSHCVLGGGVGVGGGVPIELANGVVVSGMSHVAQSLARSGVYSAGTLVAPTREWKRNALRLRELDRLVRRVRALERALGTVANDEGSAANDDDG